MTIGYISKLSKHVGIGLNIYSLEAWAKCVNTVTAFMTWVRPSVTYQIKTLPVT